MDTVDLEIIARLAEHRSWPAISIYLPAHPAGTNRQEESLKLKNLLKDAVERMVGEGLRRPDAEAIAEPARAILEDREFWRQPAEGIAVFTSADTHDVYRLDVSMPEQVVVGDRFYVRPLVTAYHGRQEFYALALDKGGVRLFAGDRTGAETIDLDNTPTSRDESAKYDVHTPLRHAASHAAHRRHGGQGSPSGGAFPGHGQEPDYEVDVLNEYVRQVAAAVERAIERQHDRPFVLIGPERVLAAYRRYCAHPVTAQTNTAAETEWLTPEAVRKKALDVLDGYFTARIEKQLSELTENEGTGLVSHDPVEIVQAAATGRVRMLFFDESYGPFGQFDRERFEVTQVCDATPRFLRERQDPVAGPADGECGWDLVDLAVAETTLHGGELRAFQGEDTPVNGVAAIMRY